MPTLTIFNKVTRIPLPPGRPFYQAIMPITPEAKQSMRVATIPGGRPAPAGGYAAHGSRISAAAYRDLTGASKGGGKTQIKTYQSAQVVAYEKAVQAFLLQQLPKPIRRLTGPLELELVYIFPFLVKHRAPTRAAVEAGQLVLWRDTKPDLTDNLNKPVADAMQGLIMENDSAISRFNAVKVYGPQPHVILTVAPLQW